MTFIDVFEEFRFVIELLVFQYIFVIFSNEKKEHFYLKSIIGVIFILAFSLNFYFVKNIVSDHSQKVLVISTVLCRYSLLTLLTIILIKFCFKVRFAELSFKTLGAYACQHICYVIVNEVVAIGLWPELRTEWQLYFVYAILSLASLVILALIIIYFFKDYFEVNNSYIFESKRSAVFYLLFLVIFIASSFVFQSIFNGGYINEDNKYNYFGAIEDILVCVLILFIERLLLKSSYLHEERVVAEQLLKQNEIQFKTSKKNMDLINQKSHDLKHQISALRSMDEGEKNKSMDEIINIINKYDSNIRTGNEVLDTILSEKNAYCVSHEIKLSCSINVNEIKCLSTLEMYTLFGNILDNAIEATLKIKDKSKRTISLKIERVLNFISIQTNNYFEGEINFKNGLVATSKSDKNSHGYGLKSIKYIVESHKGTFQVSKDKDVFILEILLPFLP